MTLSWRQLRKDGSVVLSQKQLGKIALSRKQLGNIILNWKKFRIDSFEWALFVYSKSDPGADIVTRVANLRNCWAAHK